MAGCLIHHGDRSGVVLPGVVHLQVREENHLEHLVKLFLYTGDTAGFKGSKFGFQN